MSFINENEYITSRPWALHWGIYRKFYTRPYSWPVHYQEHLDRGWTFFDFFSNALPSVSYLRSHGDWYIKLDGTAGNAWDDRDASEDGIWPNGRALDAMQEAWDAIQPGHTQKEWSDELWSVGIGFLGLPFQDQEKYKTGLACRVDVLMAQTLCADCIFNLLSFDGMLFVA